MILHINKLDVIMQQQPIENTAVSMTGPACRSVLTAGRATTRAARFFLFFFFFVFLFFFLLAAVLLFQRENKTYSFASRFMSLQRQCAGRQTASGSTFILMVLCVCASILGGPSWGKRERAAEPTAVWSTDKEMKQ